MRNAILVKKKFREFYLPTILMTASGSLSIIIDSIIVGNILGDNELAAVNLIMPLSLCFTALCGLFGIGSATCISLFKGRMDSENADKCLTLSTVSWVLFSIVGAVVGIFATTPVCRFLSGSSGLNHLVYDYLKVYLIGASATFATMIFPHIIKADGMPELSSRALIISNASNLIFDIVFMKFFDMGIGGAALATVVGNIIGTLILFYYFISPKRNVHFVKISFSSVKLYGDMFKMSVSSIFGQGLMFGKMWIFNMIISKTAGQAGLTAFSVCTSCLSFVSMFIAGGAQTMIPMVSAFTGAEDHTATKLTVKQAFKLVLGCCVVITVLFEIFPTVILLSYGIKSAKVLKVGISAVRLFSLSFVFIGFNFMFMYYSQAKKMPAFSMTICALEGFFVIVPLGFLLSLVLKADGIWLSYVINGIIVSAFIVLNSRRIVKKSDGELYSLFMIKKADEDTFEMSVDVSEEKEISQAVDEISQKILKTDQKTKELLENMFSLSRIAYSDKSGLKSDDTVDIIVRKNKVFFKDMGTDYRLLKDCDLMTKIKDHNDSYEHTLMIGINYSTVTL